MTIPFLQSGAVITIALTRLGGSIGRLYAADLVGAATGCALLVPLLRVLDMMSALLVAGTLAAAGGVALARFAGPSRWRWAAPATVGLLAITTLGHLSLDRPIEVAYTRGVPIDTDQVESAVWNSHSYVLISRPATNLTPLYWGPGRYPSDLTVDMVFMNIDGEAGTPLTQWDGNPESLHWVQYDVTALPYQLRSGDVGIIGAGGGRDILSAIWVGATSVTAIELNRIFIDVLRESHRDYTRIAEREEVRLVHDEARSYLTRSDQRFDVLQMSLVDTWAATGAGAYALSENALYTLEAWRVFLARLKPHGVLSTSRCFSPANASETSRLLSLCVATLLDAGVENPQENILMVMSGKVATLLMSPSPFSADDLERIDDAIQRYEFKPLIVPGHPIPDARLEAIVSRRSDDELSRATFDKDLDFTAPTDERPYFFNMLKLGRFHLKRELWARSGGRA